MARLLEYKRFSSEDDDTISDTGNDEAGVTTALLGTRIPLGEPEVRRRLWFSREKPNESDAIATQASKLLCINVYNIPNSSLAQCVR